MQEFQLQLMPKLSIYQMISKIIWAVLPVKGLKKYDLSANQFVQFQSRFSNCVINLWLNHFEPLLNVVGFKRTFLSFLK